MKLVRQQKAIIINMNVWQSIDSILSNCLVMASVIYWFVKTGGLKWMLFSVFLYHIEKYTADEVQYTYIETLVAP